MFSRIVLLLCVLGAFTLLAETKSIRRQIARRSSLSNKHWRPQFHRSPLRAEIEEPSVNDGDMDLYAYNKPALHSSIEGRNKLILAEEEPFIEGRNKFVFPESESSLESPHTTAPPVITVKGLETNENDARIRELMRELVTKSRYGNTVRPVVMQKPSNTESGLTAEMDNTQIVQPLMTKMEIKNDMADGTKALDTFLDEALQFFRNQGKDDIKEETKEETKEESKEATKEEAKEEIKEETKEETNEETKEEAKEEIKEETKEEAKEEIKEATKEETTTNTPSQLPQPQEVLRSDVTESNMEAGKDTPKSDEVIPTTSTIRPEPMTTEQYDSIEESQLPLTMQDSFVTSTASPEVTTTEQHEAGESTTQSPLEKINDSRDEIIDEAIKRIMNSFESTTEQNDRPIEETTTTGGGQLAGQEITPPSTEETSTLQHTSTTEVNDGMTTSTEMPLAGGDTPSTGTTTTMTVRVLDATEEPLHDATKSTVEETTVATDVNIRMEEITSQSPWLTEVIENNATTTTSAPIEGMHEMDDVDERFDRVTANGSATTNSSPPPIEEEGKVEASGNMQEIEIKFENMLKSEIESLAEQLVDGPAAMSGGQKEDGAANATTQLSKLLHEDVSSTINCFTVVSLPAQQMNGAGNGAPNEKEQAAAAEEIIKRASENTSINTAVGHKTSSSNNNNTNNNNTNWPPSNDMNMKSKCPPTTTMTMTPAADGPSTVDGEAASSTTTTMITTATDNRTQMPSIEKEMTDIYKGNNQELHAEDGEGTDDVVDDADDDDEDQQDDDADDASDYESDDDDESDEDNDKEGDEETAAEVGQDGEPQESAESRDEIGGVPVAYLPSNQANIVHDSGEPAMAFTSTETMKQSEDKHETAKQDNRNDIKTFTIPSAATQAQAGGQLNDASQHDGDANADEDDTDDDVAPSNDDGNPYAKDTTPYHSPNGGAAADDHSSTGASGVVATAADTDATRTNWWSSVTYEEIRNFLNTIFDSATNELYEEIARKSKEMRTRTTGNGPAQWDSHSKLNTLWSLW